MILRQLFDCESCNFTYLIADETTRQAVFIDSVLEQIDRDLQLLQELNLTLYATLETHLHADHITASGKLREKTQCEVIVPANSDVVGADKFIGDGEILQFGDVTIKVIATPGHTECHLTFHINNKFLLTGDTLLIRSCGRTDFQDGDAGQLYDSVTKKLFTLPEETIIFPGHDYLGFKSSTIAEEKHFNPRLANHSRAEFIELMANLNLALPKKIDIAVPANLRCGIIQ